MAGENASTLIFACSISDFSFIDQKKYEVVSIIGNSMGWYTTLVLGNVLSIKQGYELIHTMGSMMKNQIIGGQIIYPIVDDAWIGNKEKKTNIIAQVKKGCDNDLSKVKSCIKLTGFVNSTDEFIDQPKVLNGASDLIASVFGDAGMHTRAAVSTNSLPLGVSVEVDAIFELK